jgi:hypothetical protein
MKTAEPERSIYDLTWADIRFIGMLAFLSWAIVGLAAFVVWEALQ